MNKIVKFVFIILININVSSIVYSVKKNVKIFTGTMLVRLMCNLYTIKVYIENSNIYM